MSKHAFEIIAELNRRISQAVREYAATNGITYEQAADLAYLTFNGRIIEPIKGSRIEVNMQEQE